MNHYKIKRSKEHLAGGGGGGGVEWRGKKGLELKGVEGRRLVSWKLGCPPPIQPVFIHKSLSL